MSVIWEGVNSSGRLVCSLLLLHPPVPSRKTAAAALWPRKHSSTCLALHSIVLPCLALLCLPPVDCLQGHEPFGFWVHLRGWWDGDAGVPQPQPTGVAHRQWRCTWGPYHRLHVADAGWRKGLIQTQEQGLVSAFSSCSSSSQAALWQGSRERQGRITHPPLAAQGPRLLKCLRNTFSSIRCIYGKAVFCQILGWFSMVEDE